MLGGGYRPERIDDIRLASSGVARKPMMNKPLTLKRVRSMSNI